MTFAMIEAPSSSIRGLAPARGAACAPLANRESRSSWIMDDAR
jgi:hypothetical protein